ncbi:hypothetical protein AGMMS49944_22970 [Spirochaetia bacterium]|nr:hypothetical protein AGMMS49944_22970 [Spirochaetia bacterium]
MITTSKEEPMTFEQIRAMFQDIGRKQEETGRVLEKLGKETDKRIKEVTEQLGGMGNSRKAVDRQLEITGKRIKEISEQLGGMGNSNGAFAEDYFANALREKKMFAGLQFDELETNMKSKQGAIKDEFDIVMYNGNSVALIEVKYKAKTEDLEKMVKNKASNFRTLFPYYAGHKVYLGIASLSFNDYVYAKAKELGIGMLKQKGDTIEADTSFVRAY